ncbi:nuclear transport factor 2 family protein [Streptomyces arenae]|uniref:nuclear transport factor 2 family protein n=1 Tax=Streptomyces arenae TaxID=29301 RepID=UPI00265AC0DC|nr:nuclear transport factor 2 family protein [Streptomyces arenae]MCG7210125.1 nuclear transport factor 2 family protein [Streptomyces arenae]
MPNSANITLVRRFHESRMAPEVIAETVASDIVWDITPGFPGGGVYQGWDSVARDFFGPMRPNFEALGSVPEQYFTDGDGHVFVLGQYHPETKAGNKADVRFIHLWTIRDGKIAGLVQAADSHVLQQALNS